MKQELKVSSSAWFITLTYDDEHLPISEDGIPTLRKEDLSLFLKRLRSKLDRGYDSVSTEGKTIKKTAQNAKIRFFACGEYGSQTKRPHYHAILFNLPEDYEVVSKAWALGQVYYGDVTTASISYVTKYIMKKTENYDGQEKPYNTMSRRFAIGANYVNEHKNFHKENKLFEVRDTDLGKLTIPRYYKEKIFEKSEILTNSKENERVAKKCIESAYKRACANGTNPYNYLDKQKENKQKQSEKRQKSNEKL